MLCYSGQACCVAPARRAILAQCAATTTTSNVGMSKEPRWLVVLAIGRQFIATMNRCWSWLLHPLVFCQVDSSHCFHSVRSI